MKSLKLVLTVLALVVVGALAPPRFAQATTMADIVFVVDESASMNTEHAWIPTMALDLEAALVAAGVTNNRYALTGFVENTGAHGAGSAGPHKHAVGGADFGTAADIGGALVPGLSIAGFALEDGHEAIDFALDNYAFRGGAAVNIILIADEDRDDTTGGTITFDTVRQKLQANNALLNVVVNARFEDGLETPALGIDFDGNAYTADGGGGFNTSPGGVPTGVAQGTTVADYVNLALAVDGAAWDLNQLRAGGLTATSFTAAFVDVKVEEIVQQVPEPTTLALLGLAIAGLGFRRRRL